MPLLSSRANRGIVLNTDANGARLLTAVERVVDDCDNLIAYVEALKESVPRKGRTSDARHAALVADRIVQDYSTRAAVAGGLTAFPALLPGGGTFVAVFGGSLVDMVYMLKHEVEMALCLTHLYGHDIRDEKERWLAYTLAAVSTYEAKSGRNYFYDLADAELEAFSKYTPRQMSKLAATVMGRIALERVSRNLIRALPLVGIAVSASFNKLVTTSVGWRCTDALARRARAERSAEDFVVEAEVVG